MMFGFTTLLNIQTTKQIFIGDVTILPSLLVQSSLLQAPNLNFVGLSTCHLRIPMFPFCHEYQ